MFLAFVYTVLLPIRALPQGADAACTRPDALRISCATSQMFCEAQSDVLGPAHICFDDTFDAHESRIVPRQDALRRTAGACGIYVLGRGDYVESEVTYVPMDHAVVPMDTGSKMGRYYDVYAADGTYLGELRAMFSQALFEWRMNLSEMSAHLPASSHTLPLRIFSEDASFGLYQSYFGWFTGTRIATSQSCSASVQTPCMQMPVPDATTPEAHAMLGALMALHLRTCR